jgi:hypothetical protein
MDSMSSTIRGGDTSIAEAINLERELAEELLWLAWYSRQKKSI